MLTFFQICDQKNRFKWQRFSALQLMHRETRTQRMASWLHPKIQTAMPGSFVVVRIFALEKKPRVASCKKWTWPYLTIEEWWLGDNPVLFGWALLRGYVCTWNRSLKKSFNMCCSSSFWMKQISIGHIEVIDDIWWYKIYIYIYILQTSHRTPTERMC